MPHKRSHRKQQAYTCCLQVSMTWSHKERDEAVAMVAQVAVLSGRNGREREKGKKQHPDSKGG